MAKASAFLASSRFRADRARQGIETGRHRHSTERISAPISTRALQSPFDGDHGEEELVWVILQRYEFVVNIEGVGGFVQSFNDNADRRYLRCGSPTSVQGIHQEKATEVLAPARTADCQSPEQGGRKTRIARKPLGNGFRQFTEQNAISRERIVAVHRTPAINHDEGSGDFSSSILAGLMMDVAVEFRNA